MYVAVPGSIPGLRGLCSGLGAYARGIVARGLGRPWLGLPVFEERGLPRILATNLFRLELAQAVLAAEEYVSAEGWSSLL